MKKILILCLAVLLVPGVMAGCSQNEQPVQEQPLQEQPNVIVAKPLQDMVNQVNDQAQDVMDEAQTTAGKTVEAVQTKAAEVVGDMKEQLQDMGALADTLKTDMAADVPSTDTGLADLAKEIVPVPEIPDQAMTESLNQEVQDLAGAGEESLTTQLDSTLAGMDEKIVDTTTEVSQAFSGDGAAVAEGGVAVTEELVSVTEADMISADKVAETMDQTVAAVSAETTVE